MKLLQFGAVWLGILVAAGCGKDEEGAAVKSAVSGETEAEAGEKMTPEEQRFHNAAKPFAAAVAGRQYEAVFGLLSTHAKARMSLNQFAAPADAAAAERNEKSAMTNVTAEQFATLMKKVEDHHGLPQSVQMLEVFSTDQAILARKSKEEFGALESMFAIGMMPDSIPADIRRASVRGQIKTQLSAEQLAAAAKELGTTPAELQKDPDFAPYFNFKIVLVEEAGQLKVGYFEFMPPSMLD